MENVVLELYQQKKISRSPPANITSRNAQGRLTPRAPPSAAMPALDSCSARCSKGRLRPPPRSACRPRPASRFPPAHRRPRHRRPRDGVLPERDLPGKTLEFLERKDLTWRTKSPASPASTATSLQPLDQAAVFRQIPAKILSFDDLAAGGAEEACHLDQGLVVVTSPTGSGKSTTLAAMIDYISANLARHIITIEDPIEFVHLQKSVIVHREVGEHTETFGAALKGAMRHDPDIVLPAKCAR